MPISSRVAVSWVAALVAAGASLAARSAHANPRPLPFTYISETLGKGQTEVEQYADLTPVRGSTGTQHVDYMRFQLQTEFEHGITDNLELGLYVSFAGDPPAGLATAAEPIEGNAIKQRLRWRLADVGAWPIDVALYGEVLESRTEVELEGKVILQRRFGPLRAVANLWIEQEFYFNGTRETVLHPTAGVTGEVRPWMHVGLEWWMHQELPHSDWNSNAHHYVGPALMLAFDKLWWSTGVYYRLDDGGRTLDPGDGYGALWFRTIIGLEI